MKVIVIQAPDEGDIVDVVLIRDGENADKAFKRWTKQCDNELNHPGDEAAFWGDVYNYSECEVKQ